MTSYLSDDDPELYEKVKDHGIDIPDDWEGEYPLFCKKCGKKAVQKMNMLWICPIMYEIPDKYMHPGER